MIERIEITDGTKLISHRAREVSPFIFLLWCSMSTAEAFLDCFCERIIPLCHIGNCSKEAIEWFLTHIFTKQNGLTKQRRIWSSRLLRKETTIDDLTNPAVFEVLVREAKESLRSDDEWCFDTEPMDKTWALFGQGNKPFAGTIKFPDGTDQQEILPDYVTPASRTSGTLYRELSYLASQQNRIAQESYGWKWKTDIRTFAGIPGLMVKADRPEYSLVSGLARMPEYTKYMIYPTGDNMPAIAQQIKEVKAKYEWV